MKKYRYIFTLLALALLMLSCGNKKKSLRSAQFEMVDIFLSQHKTELPIESFVEKLSTVYDKDSVLHYIGKNTLDLQTGQQIMTVGLQDIQVTARSRSLAERNGQIKIEFMMSVPASLLNEHWELQLFPHSSKVELLPVSIQGEEFQQKQKKQYDFFASLTEVVFSDHNTKEYINTTRFENEIARKNSKTRRSALLKKQHSIPVVAYRLESRSDSLTLFEKYIEKRKIERNEYLKKTLQEKYTDFVRLEKLNPVLIDTVVPPLEPFTFLYSMYVPSKGLSGRIPVQVDGFVRSVNNDLFKIMSSDSLTFSVSSLTDLIIPELKNRYADLLHYEHGINLLLSGEYEKSMFYLSHYKDSNVVIAYLSENRNREALNLLEELEINAVSAYLSAVALCRMGEEEKACKMFLQSCELDKGKKFRGNLDPEISYLIKKYDLSKEEDY